MRHHLALAQYAVLGAFTLFVIFIVLSAADRQFAGKATTATTVNVSPSAPANCTLSVGAGYNLVSLPCLGTAEPVLNVTSGVDIIVMYQYAPGTPDVWKVYNPDLPSYVVSDLQYMTRRAGYILIANNSLNRTFQGKRVSLTDVPIIAGWNLVGYPSFNETNVSDALAGINSSYTVVVGYNKSAEQFINYTNPGGGDLVVLTPGQGYWINGTQVATWQVSP